MGHGIEVYELKEETETNEKLLFRIPDVKLYLSYNFGRVEDMLREYVKTLQEITSEQKEMIQKHPEIFNGQRSKDSNIDDYLFLVSEHMYLKRVHVVQCYLKRSINILNVFGIKKGIPDVSNGSWSYGISGETKTFMKAKEFLEVFRFHLESFNEALVKMDPQWIFVEELPGNWVIIEDEDYYFAKDNDNIEEKVKASPGGMISYYRDMEKGGNMLIQSFEDAMYAFYQSKKFGYADESKQWLAIAMQMKDCPLKI